MISKIGASFCACLGVALAFGVAYADFSGPDQSGAGTLLSRTLRNQVIKGGAVYQDQNLGTISSGTLQVQCGLGPTQYAINGGSFTLAAPTVSSMCNIQLTNNGSAGSISFSGFSEGSNTGDTLDTTSTHIFTIIVWCINGTSQYRVAAAQ